MYKCNKPIASGPGARRAITMTTASQITPTGGVQRRIMLPFARPDIDTT